MKFIVALSIAFAALASAGVFPPPNRPFRFPIGPSRTDDVEVAPVPMPKCAKGCIRDAIKKVTKCEENDVPCVCANLQLVSSEATNCVLHACGLVVTLGEVRPAALAQCGKTV